MTSPTSATLSWDDVRGQRLARHFLLEPAPADRLVDVVGAVCGIHSQVMSSAEVSLGLRVAGITRQQVQDALWQRRTLVKTYGLRGTVHVFPAHEMPIWLAALRANPPPGGRSLTDVTLDPARQAAVVTAIGEALDGAQLTRAELGERVAERVGGWAMERVGDAFATGQPAWLYAIREAATAGVLCFGPNRGNQVTFVRLDQWLAGAQGSGTRRRVGGEAALAEVLRRYLAAYGPATAAEFARWFTMDPPAARGLLRTLGDEVVEVDVEGSRRWALAEDAVPGARPHPASVRLLAQFDCYVVGCHPRDQLLPANWTDRGYNPGTAATMPVLLVDGAVAGVWQRRKSGKRLEVRVEPFGRLTARQRTAVQAEAARIGRIVEAEATVSVGPVDLRPHM
jgi:Winged helix DNA-binding domain